MLKRATKTATMPDPVLGRVHAVNWPLGALPPGRALHYAFPRKDAPGLTMASAVPSVGVDEKTMSATAVISTIDVDRTGDVVVPEGCSLEQYRRNPVWFFGHQSLPLPVGTSMAPDGQLAVRVNPGRDVRATCFFHQKTLEAVQIFELVKLRALSGTSIGFNPTVAPEPLPRRQGAMFNGFRYKAWDLLECSWVGVPANPYCTVLREHLSRGRLAGDPISPVIRKALEPLATPKRAWATGATLEDPMTDKQKALIAQCARSLDRVIKALSGSSGTAGGYAQAPGQTPGQDTAPAEQSARERLPGLVSDLTRVVADLVNISQPAQQPAPAMAGSGMTDPAGGMPGGDSGLSGMDLEEEDEMPFGEEGEEEEEGGESAGEEEAEESLADQNAEDEDGDEDEDPLAKYRRAAGPRRRKSMRKMSDEHSSVFAAASQHLDDLAEMEPDTKWSRMHQAACKMHSGMMRAACKAMMEAAEDVAEKMTDEDASQGEGSATDAGEKPAIQEKAALAAAIRAGVQEAEQEVRRRQMYELTGHSRWL